MTPIRASLRCSFPAALAVALAFAAGGDALSQTFGPAPAAVESPTSRPAATPPSVAPTATPIQPSAPVVFGGQSLFILGSPLGAVSAEERARLLSQRLQRLSLDPDTDPSAMTVEDGEHGTDILLGDRIVLTVTDGDAAVAGVSRRELAEQRAAILADALRQHSLRATLEDVAFGLLYTLLATAAFVLILKLLGRLFPHLYQRLESLRAAWIPEVRIQQLELLSAERIVRALSWLMRILRTAITLLLVYAYVSLVFSFFPWTQGLASRLLDYVLSPLAAFGGHLVAFFPSLVFIAVVVVLTRFTLKLIRLVFSGIERGAITLPGFYPDWAQPTYTIVRFAVLVLAAVVVFPYLPGSDTAAFKGISVFLGVLFSLGSTSAVANVVAGVMMTYMRPFQLGDRVGIADTVGDVVEKTLLVTRVRTVKNVDITIPNSMVLGSHIINYSSSARQRGLILHTEVTIGYDAPWRQVHELLIGAARRTANVLAEPAPFVLQSRLDDFYVSYELNAYTDQPSAMARTYSDLHQNIQDAFNEAGVEIMSPHYEALRDGNTVAIPEPHRAAGYEPPTFRASVTRGSAAAPRRRTRRSAKES